MQEAGADLLGRARAEDGPVELLVAEMVRGRRELIAGLVRDPSFGPCVMLGLGGILDRGARRRRVRGRPLDRDEARRLVRPAPREQLADAALPRRAGASTQTRWRDVLVGARPPRRASARTSRAST